MKLLNKIESYLEYIVAITFILNIYSVWTRIWIDRQNDIMLYLSIFILGIISIIDISKDRRLIRMIILIITLSVLNIIFVWLNGSNQMDFIIRFLFLLNFFIIYIFHKSKQNNMECLLIKFANIVVILAIISLIFYILGTTFNLITNSNEVLIEWGGFRYIKSYYNLYYEAQIIPFGGSRIIRNTGIFTEAPMYNFNLCIALAVLIFIDKNKNIKKIIVLLVTILTTFSTTGILIAALLVFIRIIQYKSKNNTYISIKLVLLPVVLLICIIISLYFLNDKINGTSGSYIVRMDDYISGYNAWKQHKIIGNGYKRHDITIQYTQLNNRNEGGSSALMAILPQGGLYLVILYISPLILAIRYSIKKKNINIVILSATILILFIVTNIPYSHMIIYMLASGLVLNIKE